MLVAGVDSSTQSTKVILCDAEDGTIVGRGSAPHPAGTECPPQAWWDALTRAGDGLLTRAAAVGVAGQQHGMVVLDEYAEVIRPALLWNDLRSAAAASALVAERGRLWWAERTGSVPNASFTVTKLRWLAEHEPDRAARVFRVMLPHDWVTWRLLAGPPEAKVPVTDRGDASGTGYFSPADGAWLPEVAADALGHHVELPRLARPAEAVGETGWGAAVSAGTGDNMAAALGLGLAPGEVAVSIGTSGTAYAVTTVPSADPSGAIAGFADATGRFLPLVCTINAGLVLDSVAAMLGTDMDGLSARALAAGPGAGGITLLPYFDGERTPVRPAATGVLQGLTTHNATAENLARAAVEAVLASLAEVASLLGGAGGGQPHGVLLSSVLLIGGAARSEAVRAAAPGIFGAPVDVPEPEEYVALGAARQAAWALAGTPAPPPWPRRPARRHEGPGQPGIRERFAALRDATATWDPGAIGDTGAPDEN
jgi:xylulokinase